MDHTRLVGPVWLIAGVVLRGVCLSRSAAASAEGGQRSGRPGRRHHRLPGLLGVHLLTGAFIFGIPLLGALPLIVVESAGPDVPLPIRLLMGLLIVVTSTFGNQQYVVLSLAAPAYVLEGIGPVAALAPARELAVGCWWRIVRVFVLAGLVGYAVFLGVVVVAMVIAGLLSAADVHGVVVSTLSSIRSPVRRAGVVGLIHTGLRIRHDQFDLVAMVRR
jgi:hypothetical protein